MKPVILVTRKLPEAVEDRLKRDYSPILNPDDTLYTSDEIIKRAEGAEAIMPCHTEQFTAAVIERLPDRYHVHSDLVRDVKPGGNTFDFRLRS